MHILYSPKFARQYKKLPLDVKNTTTKKERIFLTDPFDPRLKTHKLSGAFDGLYAFSVSHSIRIIFKKSEDVILFLQIGDHDIYD